jgi:NAD(P)H-hydrate repair Nnr-like enzyme with NAD(P)H-hydrate dehydratase domain
MITGMTKADVLRAPDAVARRVAASSGAVVALKGAVTFIAAPDGELFRNDAGNVGLATSGSGDTLAGIVVGLSARGATPLQSAAWAVHMHACAGDRLAARFGGPLGFLARELLAELPGVMAQLGARRRRPAKARKL